MKIGHWASKIRLDDVTSGFSEYFGPGGSADGSSRISLPFLLVVLLKKPGSSPLLPYSCNCYWLDYYIYVIIIISHSPPPWALCLNGLAKRKDFRLLYLQKKQ